MKYSKPVFSYEGSGSIKLKGGAETELELIRYLIEKRFLISIISWFLSIASLFFGSFCVEGWRGVGWGLIITMVLNGIAYFVLRIKKETIVFKDGKITYRNSKEKTE